MIFLCNGKSRNEAEALGKCRRGDYYFPFDFILREGSELLCKNYENSFVAVYM